MDERAGPGRRHNREPDATAGARSRQGPPESDSSPVGKPTAASPAPFVERRATLDGRRIRPPTPRVALIVFAAVVTGILLYQGRGALSPFVVGLLIVYLLDPPVERLARLGLPRWMAVIVVYAIVIIVLAQVVGFMMRPVIEQVRTFVDDFPRLFAQAREFYDSLNLPPAVRQAVEDWVAEGGIDPTFFLPVVNLAGGFLGGIVGYIIVPVWAFYLLKDRPELTRAFDRAMPEAWRHDVWTVIREVERVFRQWVRAQLFLGVTVGVATFIGLEILNLTVDPVFGRFALLLAISAGVLELLPIIGPIIAAIPAILLAATAGPEAVVAAFLLYLLVQQVENNVLVPKIQGDAVELHPSAVMFALVVGGAIAGLLGAILALPVTAAGRNVVRYLFGRLSTGEDAAAGPAPPGARLPERASRAGAASRAGPASGGDEAPAGA